MKTTSNLLVWLIIATIISTVAVTVNRGITVKTLFEEINNLNKEAAEMAEETVDLIIHTIHHQTINPPVVGEVATSLIRGIAVTMMELATLLERDGNSKFIVTKNIIVSLEQIAFVGIDKNPKEKFFKEYIVDAGKTISS